MHVVDCEDMCKHLGANHDYIVLKKKVVGDSPDWSSRIFYVNRFYVTQEAEYNVGEVEEIC